MDSDIAENNGLSSSAVQENYRAEHSTLENVSGVYYCTKRVCIATIAYLIILVKSSVNFICNNVSKVWWDM